MATTSEALVSLGIKEWVLRGNPTTEEEFLSMFRKVTGKTSDGSAVESDKPSEWGGLTWKKVSDEIK